MVYLAAALMLLGFVAAGVFLIVSGHPWLGFFCLLCGGCVSVGGKSE